MPPEYTLRDAAPEDFGFYKDLHHAVFKELVMPIWGWDPEVQLRFVRAGLDPEKIKIIQLNEISVGVVQLEEKPDHIFLSQLWIAPEYQSQGIGSKILDDAMNKAAEGDLLLRLHVLKTNRAKAWYERLGFVEDGTDEGGFFMRWEGKS